jgi:hypothetical protein
LQAIEASKTDTLADARALLKRMRRRELYEFIDEYLLPPELTSRIPVFTSEALATQTSLDGVALDPEDIVVSDGRLNYNFKDRNPVDNVSFYGSGDLDAKFHIPKEQVSLLFPEKVRAATRGARSAAVCTDRTMPSPNSSKSASSASTAATNRAKSTLRSRSVLVWPPCFACLR